MKLWRRISIYLLVGASAMALAACSGTDGNGDGEGGPEGSISGDKTPSLSVEPLEVNFDSLDIGESQTRVVIVENTGDAPLEVSSIKLTEGDEDSNREFKAGQIGQTWFNSKTVEPDGFFELEVTYAPLNAGTDTGSIKLETNDPENQNFEIALIPTALSPRIKVDEKVNFRSTPPGTAASRMLTIQNIGEAPLNVSKMTLSGSKRFKVKGPADQGSGDGSNMEDKNMGDNMGGGGEDTAPKPEDDIPLDEYLKNGKEVAPGEDFDVRVWFEPEDNSPEKATLTIFNNDTSTGKEGAKGRKEVTIVGNSKSACLGLSHEETIDFGNSSIDNAATKTVTMENCRPRAADDLKVFNIEIKDGAGGAFKVKEGSIPSDLSRENALVIKGDNRSNFVVTFTPTENKKYEGKLKIESNDPSRQEHIIDLVGKGSDNECPEAIAEGTIEGAGRTSTTINTLPLETIVFDGSKSSDPDGSVQRYEWSIIERPEDSTARLTPNANAKKPKLFLDLAGTYKVELVVYDDKSTASCGKQAIVTIKAIPDEDIHVQLVWDTPGDADQTDSTGADLDLHYLNPRADAWNDSPWDIFWHNKEADWGQQNVKSDDPSLDIDDTNGAGPENVNHDNPKSGLTYEVGVYYYDDHGFGPSYATVRIYIQKKLVKEYKNKFMSGTFDFWKVAGIEWPTGNIYEDDEKFNGFP